MARARDKVSPASVGSPTAAGLDLRPADVQTPTTASRLGLLAVLRNPWVLRVLGLVFLLSVWEAWSRSGRVDPTLVAGPSRIVSRIPRVLTHELYGESLLSTLDLLARGFFLSVAIGITLGVVVGRIRVLDRALTPYLNALYAAPVPALAPILTITIGFGIASKLVVVVLVAVFPILINVQAGVKATDEDLIEVGRSFGASERQIWTHIVLPFAVPFIGVGLRLGVARALIGTVVAEFYTSPDGLGFLILIFARRFDTASMMTPVLTYTVLGLLLVGAFTYLERRLSTWRVT